MHRHLTLTAVMLSAVFICGGHAYAEAPDGRDVLTTKDGVIVLNTFHNCVRTKWEAGTDPCGVQAPPPPLPPAAIYHEPRRPIAQDERTVYFGFNRSNLSVESKQKLDDLAGILKSQEDVKGARIVGYADRVGSASYNEKLSGKRAEAVRKYIVSRGFVNARVAETRWLGESSPVTSCPDTLTRPELIKCLQKDRRVEVEIDYLPNR